jgi:hypothetical protein
MRICCPHHSEHNIFVCFLPCFRLFVSGCAVILFFLNQNPHQEIHHDYIDHDLNRAQGVRILTVFLYLNNVEEGTCI